MAQMSQMAHLGFSVHGIFVHTSYSLNNLTWDSICAEYFQYFTSDSMDGVEDFSKVYESVYGR